MRVLAAILIAAGLPLAGIRSAAADTQGNLTCDSPCEKIGRWLAERQERFGTSGTLQFELARIKSSMRVYDVTVAAIVETPREYTTALVDLDISARCNGLLKWKHRPCLPGTELGVGDTLRLKTSSFYLEKITECPTGRIPVEIGRRYLMIEDVYAGPDPIDCQGYAYRSFYLYPIAEAGIVIGHCEEGGEPITTVISLDEMARLLAEYDGDKRD